MAVHRGEIYFVNLNPVKGREQAGQRPVLVLSVDAINKLPLVVTVVVGTKGENISQQTFVYHQKRVVYRWRRFSYAFKFVHWIPNGFPKNRQVNFQIRYWKGLEMSFVAVSVCDR